MEINTDSIGTVKIIGSGSEFLVDIIKNFSFPSFPNNYNPQFNAISSGLSLTGMSLCKEIGDYESLLNYYGGGYELVSIFGNKFRKVNNYLLIIWHVASDEDKNYFYPAQICKYLYFNDVLLIRVFRHIDWTRDMQKKEFKESRYYVNPIYRDVSREEERTFVVPPLNSTVTLNCVLTQNSQEKKFDFHSFVIPEDIEKPFIKFHNSDDSSAIRFSVDGKFIEKGLTLSLSDKNKKKPLYYRQL